MEGIIFQKLSPEQEAAAVKETEMEANANVKEGDHVYLISSKWFKQWMAYTGFKVENNRMSISRPAEPGPPPGPIDSSDLISDAPPLDSNFSDSERAEIVNLRANALEHRDFRVISEPTFQFLEEIYKREGPAIRRERMQVGTRQETEVDVQQMHFKVLIEDEPESVTILPASHRMTMRNLKRRACLKAELNEADYVLFDYKGLQSGKQLDELMPTKTVSGAGLTDQQALLLRPRAKVEEERQQQQQEEGPPALAPALPAPIALPAPSVGTGTSPRLGTSPMMLGSSFGSPSSPLSRSISNPPAFADEDKVVPDPHAPRGLAGLGNLGNTCFMNSGLQCLAHTPILLHIFLSGSYQHDLNPDNPMGLGGKLAESFAGLLSKLWAGEVAYVRPSLFKWRLSRFAPQFKGYNQQDSQELLTFLLDGLHEDLNRVKNKPYIELKDSGDRTDDDLAAEALSVYKARNDSIIGSSFTGLYRSLLTCPTCGFESRTMEPIMYLSLPLPASKMRTISLTVVHIDGSRAPALHAFTVSKSSTVGNLVAAVAQAAGIAGQGHEQRVLLAEASYRLDTFRDLAAPISVIKESSSGFRFSSPSPRLLAYVYAESWEGKREVQVTHKTSSYSSLNLPTSVFFLPEVELEALQAAVTKDSYDWRLGPGTSLEARVDRLLRPCHKPQPEAPAPAAPTAAAGSAGCSRVGDSDAGTSLMDLDPAAEDGGAAPAAAAAAAEDSDAAAAAAGEAAASAEAAIEIDVAADDSSEPFDMFAKQEQQQQQQEAAAAAAAAADGAPPFKLKLSSYSSLLPQLKDSSDPLYLTAEWDSARLSGLYDKAAWESPAPHESELAAREQRRNPTKVTLDDCLKSFLEPECLDSDNSWFCSKCKEHVQADKKLDMWSLPDVLMVHLKRFTNSRYSRDKLDTPVEFPLEGLDMAPYLLPRGAGAGSSDAAATPLGGAVYDCFAVSNHYGGLGGGHYTAYAKLPGGDDQWYCFDDSHVSKVDPHTVQSPAAYVLFYQRRGSAIDGLPLPPPSPPVAALDSTASKAVAGPQLAADVELAAAGQQQLAADDSELVVGGEMELA